MISYYCHITNYPGFVFHPPPTSLNQLGGLGSAVSSPSRVGPGRKHVCDILNKENAAGDNKTIYIFYIRHSSERSGTIVSSRPKKVLVCHTSPLQALDALRLSQIQTIIRSVIPSVSRITQETVLMRTESHLGLAG